MIKKTTTKTTIKAPVKKPVAKKPVNEPKIAQAKIINEPQDNSINGLGDVVKKVTNFLGIETCDECEERRKKLNKLFPFIKSAKELSEDEIAFLKRIKPQNFIGGEDIRYLYSVYNRVFSKKVEACFSCSGMIVQFKEELWNAYLANQSKNINE